MAADARTAFTKNEDEEESSRSNNPAVTAIAEPSPPPNNPQRSDDRDHCRSPQKQQQQDRSPSSPPKPQLLKRKNAECHHHGEDEDDDHHSTPARSPKKQKEGSSDTQDEDDDAHSSKAVVAIPTQQQQSPPPLSPLKNGQPERRHAVDDPAIVAGFADGGEGRAKAAVRGKQDVATTSTPSILRAPEDGATAAAAARPTTTLQVSRILNHKNDANHPPNALPLLLHKKEVDAPAEASHTPANDDDKTALTQNAVQQSSSFFTEPASSLLLNTINNNNLESCPPPPQIGAAAPSSSSSVAEKTTSIAGLQQITNTATNGLDDNEGGATIVFQAQDASKVAAVVEGSTLLRKAGASEMAATCSLQTGGSPSPPTVTSTTTTTSISTTTTIIQSLPPECEAPITANVASAVDAPPLGRTTALLATAPIVVNKVSRCPTKNTANKQSAGRVRASSENKPSLPPKGNKEDAPVMTTATEPAVAVDVPSMVHSSGTPALTTAKQQEMVSKSWQLVWDQRFPLTRENLEQEFIGSFRAHHHASHRQIDLAGLTFRTNVLSTTTSGMLLHIAGQPKLVGLVLAALKRWLREVTRQQNSMLIREHNDRMISVDSRPQTTYWGYPASSKIANYCIGGRSIHRSQTGRSARTGPRNPTIQWWRFGSHGSSVCDCRPGSGQPLHVDRALQTNDSRSFREGRETVLAA